jgi:hypothetical protein
MAWNVVFIIFIKAYYTWKNAKRERIYNAMTRRRGSVILVQQRIREMRGWTSASLTKVGSVRTYQLSPRGRGRLD